MLILLLKFTVKSKCNYTKFISGWGPCPQTPTSWMYNLWKPPTKNPGYAPGMYTPYSIYNTHIATDDHLF